MFDVLELGPVLLWSGGGVLSPVAREYSALGLLRIILMYRVRRMVCPFIVKVV